MTLDKKKKQKNRAFQLKEVDSHPLRKESPKNTRPYLYFPVA